MYRNPQPTLLPAGARAEAAVGAVAGRHAVDLDTLSFNRGGHFMSNKSCTLPEGSFRWGGGGHTQQELHAA